MLRRALPIAAICGLGCVAVVQCGSSKAGLGEFCDADADCSPGLVCENNICVSGGSDDCTPACQEFQTCFQGSCVDIGDPNDKDGDGSPTGVDCDDFNAQINPDAHEYCDGVDNNCNGLVDEGCPACADGDVQPCGTDIGECIAGVQTCNSGGWGVCSGTAPQPERCDNRDNDCDGLTDEGLEADQAPDTCALAQELGGLPDNVEGGSRVTVIGNLWPPDDEDWYKVTANDDVNEDLEDGCDSFHFAARFDSNPGALVLDIYTDGCAPEALECRDADSFNHFYDFNDMQGGQPVGQCGCQGVDPLESVEGLNLCTDDTKTFYIRVHAGEGSVQTCENYELTFSNGVPVPVE